MHEVLSTKRGYGLTVMCLLTELTSGRLLMANVGCQFYILEEEETSVEEFSPPHWLIGYFLGY